MPNQDSRGAFIVVEGCDRAGKTTQCKKIVEYLNSNNIPAKYIRFPDRSTSTTTGQIIDEYLLNKVELSNEAAHLLFTANRWEREPMMRKLVNEGTTLIIDRYSYSGVVYSSAKGGMNLSWCFEPEKGLPKPDAVILFKLNEAAMVKRKGFGEERFENAEFQQKVAKNFELLKDETWIDVDADKDIDTLFTEVQDIVKDTIKKAQTTPLLKL